ncbi:MAG: PilW family protein [Nitrospira sp.]
MRRMWQTEEGMTLIEVMVATVVTIIVVMAAMTIVVTSNKATQVNEQAADTQQNVRLAMDLISQDIKLAGFNMTSAVGTCVVGPLNVAAPIVPGDNVPGGAVGAINDVGPDQVRLLLPSMTAGSGGGVPVLSAIASGGNTITLSSVDVSAMVASGLAIGSVVSLGGSFSSPVTAVGATSLTLLKSLPPPAQFPIGTPIYLQQCVTYSISAVPAVCGGSTSCLLRNGVPMVDGIEDLQLAYACDGCNTLPPNTPLPNGVIDDQDAPGLTPIGSGVFNAADYITNNTWAVSPMTPDKIKLVQITIVARDNQASKGLSENALPKNSSAPVIASDHNPSTDAGYNATTYSQQRRRVLTKTIQVRNLES